MKYRSLLNENPESVDMAFFEALYPTNITLLAKLQGFCFSRLTVPWKQKKKAIIVLHRCKRTINRLLFNMPVFCGTIVRKYLECVLKTGYILVYIWGSAFIFYCSTGSHGPDLCGDFHCLFVTSRLLFFLNPLSLRNSCPTSS